MGFPSLKEQTIFGKITLRVFRGEKRKTQLEIKSKLQAAVETEDDVENLHPNSTQVIRETT